MKIRINKLLDRAPIPGGQGELLLYQRNEEYTIEVAGVQGELMTTAHHASEDALAELALQRVGRRSKMRVLVGGLGMGFTLAAVLRNMGGKGRVVVAELVPQVVEWNRDHVGSRAGKPLDDPRTHVHVGDVLDLVRAADGTYDAILLDTDNGPEGLTQRANDRLYSGRGLLTAFRALKPGGVLAVWSTHGNAAFTKRLQRTGFIVHEQQVFAHGTKGTRHHLWFAQRPMVAGVSA